mmetsp:Transcript_13813/g.55510  ORF Transcript_13813/g.55510 Transcript_13813/m.55510 type:complete len:257 (-) Transcript_13813:4361-5131(-)
MSPIRELSEDMKTAMVTGATGALGRAVVDMLLRIRFKVVVHDSNLDALNEMVANLGDKATNDNLYPICFDATDPESVSAACKRIDSEFSTVYVLINNAGTHSQEPTNATSLAEWHRVFAANVDSAFLLSKELLPAMKQRKWGRIVNTCSLAAKTGGVTTGVSFASSKGALHSLTFALARECAKCNVTVNGVAPAYVRTAANESFPADMSSMLLKYIPVGRFCEPEEFAHTVEFLISPKAGFITGEIIDMNGGLVMD